MKAKADSLPTMEEVIRKYEEEIEYTMKKYKYGLEIVRKAQEMRG